MCVGERTSRFLTGPLPRRDDLPARSFDRRRTQLTAEKRPGEASCRGLAADRIGAWPSPTRRSRTPRKDRKARLPASSSRLGAVHMECGATASGRSDAVRLNLTRSGGCQQQQGRYQWPASVESEQVAMVGRDAVEEVRDKPPNLPLGADESIDSFLWWAV
jgi:hypothetical protein